MTAPVYREWAECEVPPQLEAVAPALALLGAYLRQRACPEEFWPGIELAVAEALNNAVEHGCPPGSTTAIELRWCWQHTTLVVDVAHPGHFEPSADWAQPPADPLEEGGRGGFLITSLMDEVEHRNDARGYRLRLRKHLGCAPRPLPDPAATERELALMTQDLSDSYESLSALFGLSELLATSPNFDAFLGAVLTRLRSLISADAAYARFAHENQTWTLYSIQELTAPADSGPSPSELETWQTQRDRSLSDTPLGHRFICPIAFQGRAHGVLVVSRQSPVDFTAGQLNLVRTVCDFLAITRTTEELHLHRESQLRAMRELEIAASIQHSLLPETFPTTAAWRVFGRCDSAQVVGGDYFDIICRDDGGILVVIADVMGKGLPAALLASIFRTSLRARVELASEPGLLLTAVNRQLTADLARLDMFITAQLAWLEPTGRGLRLASAGHCPALRFNPATAEYATIGCESGLPLGVLETSDYASEHVMLQASDHLLFVTDGLYEVEDQDGRQLGLAGLAQQARRLWQEDAKRFVTDLLEFLAVHGRGQTVDDRTLVVVENLFSS